MKNLDLIYPLKQQLEILTKEYNEAEMRAYNARKALYEWIFRAMIELGPEETSRLVGISVKELYNLKHEHGRLGLGSETD